MGNEFKSIASQDGSTRVDCGEYAGDYKIRFVVGDAEQGTIDDAGLFEIQSIACKGIMRSAVFQKDVISAIGGNLMVLPSDVLDADMTAADNSTLKIEGNETLAVGDILRMKDGTDDEWLEVTNIGSAPTYTVTRDKNGDYGADANPTWPKGTAVVSYGQSGAGGIRLSSTEETEVKSPSMSIFTHAGSPWSSITERLRLGNLDGYLGYGSTIFGIGIGDESGTNANLTYDSTNGLRLRSGTTDIFKIANDGTVTVKTITADSGTIGGFTIGGSTLINLFPMPSSSH